MILGPLCIYKLLRVMSATYDRCRNCRCTDQLSHFASGLIAMRADTKQDIHIHCLSLDRTRSRDKQWELRRQQAEPIGTGHGPDQRSRGSGSELVSVASTASASRRRRSRQAEAPPEGVEFSLTEGEVVEGSAAAARCWMARGGGGA